MKRNNYLRWLTLSLVLLIPFLVMSQDSTGFTRGRNFIDNDGNGICDHFQNGDRTARGNFIDRNNDGICDNRPSGNAVGRNYTDNNHDGICDNRQSGNYGKHCIRKGGRGCGRHGYRWGNQ